MSLWGGARIPSLDPQGLGEFFFFGELLKAHGTKSTALGPEAQAGANGAVGASGRRQSRIPIQEGLE